MDVIIHATRCRMGFATDYTLVTHGFGFDRPLRLRPCALSKQATGVYITSRCAPIVQCVGR